MWNSEGKKNTPGEGNYESLSLKQSYRKVGGSDWRPALLEMNNWDKWQKDSGDSDYFVMTLTLSVVEGFEQGSVTLLLKGPFETDSRGLSTPAVQPSRSIMLPWIRVAV